MPWYFTPYIIPLLIATLITLALASYAWQRREASGAFAFAILMLVITEWSFGYALELASAELAGKIFWAKVQYFGIASLPVAWLSFALQYTNRQKWLTRRYLVLAAIVPLITVLLVWTNETHGLIWAQTELDSSGPFVALDVTYGMWFWVNWIFSYISLLFGTFFLVRMLLGSTSAKLYQGQARMMLIGTAMPWLGNGIYVSGLNPIPNLDLTPFAFTLSGMAMVWGFSRFRLLDIVPIARQVIVESMNDGMMVFDTQNRLVDINRAARNLIDYAGEDNIGQTLTDCLSDWSELADMLKHYTEKQKEIIFQRNGLILYFDTHISPLYDQRQRLTGRLITLRDITERKRSEQILQQALKQAVTANHFKSELLAKVTYEFRTPLGVILGFSEMLQAGIYGAISEEQEKLTAKIIESTHYLTILVNELLEQGELEAGTLKLKVTSFVLSDMMNELEDKMILAQAKGLRLTVQIAPEVPPVLTGDSVRLQQILINLVGNAIKFTKQGSIQVDVYCPDKKVWAIAVSDTGPGIPAHAHEFIFEPFGQVDSSSTREHGGTGLGLSIVKQLTTLMGGEILLESKLGEGSTFTIILPLQEKEEV
jgi:PAS domain S-box-containing protein